jgi:hypothetical protein
VGVDPHAQLVQLRAGERAALTDQGVFHPSALPPRLPVVQHFREEIADAPDLDSDNEEY